MPNTRHDTPKHFAVRMSTCEPPPYTTGSTTEEETKTGVMARPTTTTARNSVRPLIGFGGTFSPDEWMLKGWDAWPATATAGTNEPPAAPLPPPMARSESNVSGRSTPRASETMPPPEQHPAQWRAALWGWDGDLGILTPTAENPYPLLSLTSETGAGSGQGPAATEWTNGWANLVHDGEAPRAAPLPDPWTASWPAGVDPTWTDAGSSPAESSPRTPAGAGLG